MNNFCSSIGKVFFYSNRKSTISTKSSSFSISSKFMAEEMKLDLCEWNYVGWFWLSVLKGGSDESKSLQVEGYKFDVTLMDTDKGYNEIFHKTLIFHTPTASLIRHQSHHTSDRQTRNDNKIQNDETYHINHKMYIHFGIKYFWRRIDWSR
jgi:hypothetical protein